MKILLLLLPLLFNLHASVIYFPRQRVWFRFAPDPVEAAQKLFEEGKIREALPELERLWEARLRNGDRKRVYWFLGQSYESLGRLDKALGIYQVAVAQYDKEPAFLIALADLYRKVELSDRALPLYHRAVRFRRIYPQAYQGLAEIQQERGFFEQAIEHYLEALKAGVLQPDQIWSSMALCFLSLGNFDQAENAAQRALEIHPRAAHWYRLAKAHWLQEKTDPAFQALHRAMEMEPDQPEYSLTEVMWLYQKGRWKEGDRKIRLLLQEEPSPLAELLYGFSLARRAESEQALELLRRAASQKQAAYVARYAQMLLVELGR